MDNDDKINEENQRQRDVSKEVQLFLSDSAFVNKTEKPELYDLETEYAKTKKNRSPKNLITFLVTIVVIALFSFAVTMYIDYKNSAIDVGIDVFDDINLKGLLNMVAQVKDDIASAMDEKANLELELEDELKQLDLRYDAEKDLILKRRLEYDQKKQELFALDRTYKKDKENLTNDYKKRIAVVDKRIEELEEQLEKYESNNLQMEEAQKSALDSERQLFELEKQEQKKEYEATIATLRHKLQEQQKQAVLDQKKAVEIAIEEYKQRINQLDPVIEDENVKRIMTELHPEFEIVKTTDEDESNYIERILAEVSEAAKNEKLDSNAELINSEVVDNSEISVEGQNVEESSESQATNLLKIFKDVFTSTKKQDGDSLFGDDSETVNKSMDDIKLISEYVEAIPFENGLSKYVVVMEELANSANHELKVQATEKIAQQNSALTALTNYFDSVYLDEKGNGTDILLEKDAVIISRLDDSFICYVVPNKRVKLDKLQGVIENFDGTFKYLTLQKVGEFVVATPENSEDLETIELNTVFVLR